ncbi:B12-binding domain-containing radical SAM protein [Solidesulfovibrio sp.]|uniref:B12-binding domain-containing radical SAM protein n=1 Tax=Solidesulfovibrio sp. TaxID=2910990 RepID=UPI00260834CD|nr:B12-binding domain-containing radical SAM protein [Solidesulfovibrio sp.]
MNILMLHPPLPLSFWSFRETLAMTGKKALLPPLGLLTVAALLPRDWNIRLVDLNVRPLVEADWDGIDLLLVTGMLVQRESLLELIAEAKARGVATAAGGAYPSTSPQEVLDAGCDFLIQGEGETTVPKMVAAIAAGRTGGTFVCTDKPSLAESPPPRFDLIALGDYESMSLQTSRGCPFACEFCDIVSLFGRAQRHKTPDQVIGELDGILRLGFRGTVFVADDNFIGNRPRAVALLERIIEWQARHGEPFDFITQASVNLGQDIPLIDLLTAANFSYVFVGIESPDDDVLIAAHKQQNVRNPLLDSLRAITANGLSVIGSFILGMDGEKAGAGERMRAFAEAADLPWVMVNVLRALPHTALWDRLKEEGRLHDGIEESGWDALTNFTPLRPIDAIFAEQVSALSALYAPGAYLGRVFRATLDMRPTRASMPGAAPKAKADPALVVAQKNRSPDFTPLLRLIWRQGVIGEARWQFWRQLAIVARRNPSRLRRYIVLCGMGENLFSFVRHIRAQAETRRCAASSPQAPTIGPHPAVAHSTV